ncbi:MAG: hypothetical protein ACI9RP_002774, partial [Cyclobacteriaceae bacterium]
LKVSIKWLITGQLVPKEQVEPAVIELQTESNEQ